MREQNTDLAHLWESNAAGQLTRCFNKTKTVTEKPEILTMMALVSGLISKQNGAERFADLSGNTYPSPLRL